MNLNQEDFRITPQEGLALMRALTTISVRLLAMAAVAPSGELFSQYIALIEDAQTALNPIVKRVMEEIGE